MFAGDEDSSGDEDGAASEEEKNEEEQQPSGGAGGSKATPLAGPTACARVSSLFTKDATKPNLLVYITVKEMLMWDYGSDLVSHGIGITRDCATLASGGAGGSKATPLAGPTACARVSSLSLKDGFEFYDRKGPADGYSARLVAAFSVRKAGAHYGLHHCVKLRCTRRFDIHFTHFPFIECSDYRATLLLGTGTLVVRTPAGACFVYGVAGEMQMAFGNAVKLSRDEWQETRPWLALPWNNARIVVDERANPPFVLANIVHEHLIPQHIRNGASSKRERCHSTLIFSRGQPLPFIMRRLLLGVQFLPAEERWRQRAVAVLLALHPSAGEGSLIRVLSPDIFRTIMRLEYSTPGIRGGPGGGSLSPT